MRVRDLLIKGGLNTSPQLSQDDLVADAVRESISGFCSEQRAKNRAEGLTGEILAYCPIVELLQRVNSRIQGMQEDTDLHMETLDQTQLTEQLSKLGVKMVGDSAEIPVKVPPPRSAHARPPTEEKVEDTPAPPVWRVIGHMSDPNPIPMVRTVVFVNARTSLEAVAIARAKGMEGVSSTTLVSEGPQPVKKYRIIVAGGLGSLSKEFEADTSEEVWDIIGKECPLFGIYEVRDNLTNEIVPEFIPL